VIRGRRLEDVNPRIEVAVVKAPLAAWEYPSVGVPHKCRRRPCHYGVSQPIDLACCPVRPNTLYADREAGKLFPNHVQGGLLNCASKRNALIRFVAYNHDWLDAYDLLPCRCSRGQVPEHGHVVD
jgi:hypothetical protein